MFKRLFTTALIFGAAAIAPPAMAQTTFVCQNRDTLIQTLESRFQEKLQGAGLQNPNMLLEVWSSEVSGSFTIIITDPDGKSCVVASGQNWYGVNNTPKAGVSG